MTDPKKNEDQELSLNQLKDAAGGRTAKPVVDDVMCFEDRAGGSDGDGNDSCLRVGIEAPTAPTKQNILGSANPGGDDI